MKVFDRRRQAMHRTRAAGRFAQHGFLKLAAAEDIALRLSAVNRKFARVLDLGAHDGTVARVLRADPETANKVGDVIEADIAPDFLGGRLAVAASEEALPFADASFDLVISALSLHWTNDLPGALIQIRRALKPDGLFIGVMLGGRTLNELRESLLAAEAEARGGAHMRVSPVLDVIDGARLLQRAGFAMPVADADVQKVRYGEPLRLLSDLRGMGETAAFADAPPPLTRGIVARAMELYRERFTETDGRVRATFEFITLSGWAPAPDQPKPKRPGSATVRLADALGVKEIPAGDKADPRDDPKVRK